MQKSRFNLGLFVAYILEIYFINYNSMKLYYCIVLMFKLFLFLSNFLVGFKLFE